MRPILWALIVYFALSALLQETRKLAHCLECPGSSKSPLNCQCDSTLPPPAFVWDKVNQVKNVIICQGEHIAQAELGEFTGQVIRRNLCYSEESASADIISNELNDSVSPTSSSSSSSSTSAIGSKRVQLTPLEDRCELKKIVLNQTSIKSLGAKDFSAFRAQELIVVDNFNLEQVDIDAFNGSRSSLRRLVLKYSSLLPSLAIEFVRTFEALEELSLQVDDLRELRRAWFQGKAFSGLKELDLRGNMITAIEDFAFFDLANLRRLVLTENNLHSISSNMFSLDLPPTRIASTKLLIRLDKNHLSSRRIAPEALTNFLRPVSLDLSGNALASFPRIPFETFLYSDYRNTINLDGNPIVCDDKTLWLLEHVSFLNYSRGGVDEDVNVGYRVQVVGELTFLYERKKPDYSYYKVRNVVCEDARNIFARLE